MVRHFFIEPCISLFFRLDDGIQPLSSPQLVNERLTAGGANSSPRGAAGRHTDKLSLTGTRLRATIPEPVSYTFERPVSCE
jgi:hypothetical protein